MSKDFDAFISHASEDKKDFVAPLADALTNEGLRVWYDEFELSIGDSLRQKIDNGLARSSFGVVVLSPSFFAKNWTQYELNGLIARQMEGEQIILPIWHRLTKNEILNIAPSLTDIVALNSSTETIENIAREIASKVTVGKVHAAPSSPPVVVPVQQSGPTFAVFYIAPANTAELPSGQLPERSFMWSPEPDGWISVLSNDEELEYHLDGTTLRIRLDWGNHWQGDEIHAHQMVSQDEPFALTIRPSGTEQVYFPKVVNTSPEQTWLGRRNRSGWMVFEVLQ